jgi:acylphosphatase
MAKQLHIFYSGRVQGIGFRYTVLDIAKQNNVCGWVKNLSDSRVEVTAVANEDELNNFLRLVNGQFSNYISDVSIQWLPVSEEFRDFQITF